MDWSRDQIGSSCGVRYGIVRDGKCSKVLKVKIDLMQFKFQNAERIYDEHSDVCLGRKAFWLRCTQNF